MVAVVSSNHIWHWTPNTYLAGTAGWLLALYGYDQHLAVQSDHALLGIRLIASVYAGAAFLAAAFCMLFYGINMNLNLTISQELSERRKALSA